MTESKKTTKKAAPKPAPVEAPAPAAEEPKVRNLTREMIATHRNEQVAAQMVKD